MAWTCLGIAAAHPTVGLWHAPHLTNDAPLPPAPTPHLSQAVACTAFHTHTTLRHLPPSHALSDLMPTLHMLHAMHLDESGGEVMQSSWIEGCKRMRLVQMQLP